MTGKIDSIKKEEKRFVVTTENPELLDATVDSSLEIAALNGQISAVLKKPKLQEDCRILDGRVEDEFGEVCYKDSLPDDDTELLNMQNEVLKHIFNLTCFFLDEIDESKHEESKLVVDPTDMSFEPIPISSLALTQ